MVSGVRGSVQQTLVLVTGPTRVCWSVSLSGVSLETRLQGARKMTVTSSDLTSHWAVLHHVTPRRLTEASDLRLCQQQEKTLWSDTLE